MKKLRLVLMTGLITVMSNLGCSKPLQDSASVIKESNGQVLYFGNPAVDGCGWIVKIDSIYYSPISIDSIYRKDGLNVVVNYQVLTTTWNCGWRSPGYKQIKINSIKKTN